MRHVLFDLPPRPRLRGRGAELATLAAALSGPALSRLALVGGGGSGKSVLAAAVAHRIRARFPGGAAWFRVGNWDHRTLLQMIALRLGAPREPLVESVRAALDIGGPKLLVLDNHENDRAMARLLEALAGTPGDLAAHRAPLPALGRRGLSHRRAAGPRAARRLSARPRAHRAAALESAGARHRRCAGRRPRRLGRGAAPLARRQRRVARARDGARGRRRRGRPALRMGLGAPAGGRAAHAGHARALPGRSHGRALAEHCRARRLARARPRRR